MCFSSMNDLDDNTKSIIQKIGQISSILVLIAFVVLHGIARIITAGSILTATLVLLAIIGIRHKNRRLIFVSTGCFLFLTVLFAIFLPKYLHS